MKPGDVFYMSGYGSTIFECRLRQGRPVIVRGMGDDRAVDVSFKSKKIIQYVERRK